MSKAQLLVSEARRRQHLTVNQRVLSSSLRGGATEGNREVKSSLFFCQYTLDTHKLQN